MGTRLAVAIVVAIVAIYGGYRQTADAASLPLMDGASARHGHATGLQAMAARGNARAQTQLGYMYQHGLGVPQDHALAAVWYHRAAEQGEPRAQHLLGLLYDKGFGVPLDFIEAYRWLNLAAAGAPRPDRSYYIRIRDAVASKLPYGYMIEGQLRSRYWQPLR